MTVIKFDMLQTARNKQFTNPNRPPSTNRKNLSYRGLFKIPALKLKWRKIQLSMTFDSNTGRNMARLFLLSSTL